MIMMLLVGLGMSRPAAGQTGGETVWVEDALPAGAIPATGGSDAWTWISSSPSPYSGSLAHQSNNASGMHQHLFHSATSMMYPAAGDKLFTYVYLDPVSPPTEVMLQWQTGSSWEQRAYWGADSIAWGTNGTNSRRYMGALPATGGWVRLEVPASQVGLEGASVHGMAFTLYGGKATWDCAGKTGSSTSVVTPTFNPAAGTYSSAQTVTISTTTSGATIRYTTDGTTPTSTSGTIYSAPVSISATTTLKAIAYKSGMTDSTVTTGIYTINLPSGTPSHSISTRYMGTNICGPNDNVRWPMLANAAKSGRYTLPSDLYTTVLSVLDANGDFNQDFGFALFDTNYVTFGNHGGTYTIKFNGKATVTTNQGTLGTPSYVGNVTTIAWSLPANPVQPWLLFTNTDRDGVGTNHDGVTNLRVMRPTAPNSAISLPDTTIFTPQIINTVSYFNAIREMSNIASGANDWEVNWNQRVKPSEPQNLFAPETQTYTDPLLTRATRDRGRSHEYMIKLANDAGVDAYINIPICASDDYITKLAQLARYGSDGVNPYTSTQANPVYPPLATGRKLYLELGNELWNWSKPYRYNTTWLHQTALATPANHPIRYDGITDENQLSFRWQVYRTMQISNIFRSVFGDSNMHTVIRPILGWQQGAGASGHQLMFLHNYYNNGDGVTHVATPQRPNYYIWGGCSTFYNSPTPPNNPPLTLDEIFNNFNQAAWAPVDFYTDVTWAKSMGLAAFCYEGGPSLGGDNGGAIWRTAWGDIRMKQEVIDTQYIMEDYGADGGNYLSVGGQDPIVKDAPGITWEYVRNVWNPTEGSPKMQGIDDLNNTTVKRAPAAGVATGPAGFLAAKYVRSSWWPAQHDTNAASVDFLYLRDYIPNGLGYFVRAPSAGTYRLRLQYTVPVATRVRVIANGHIAGILNLPAATSATWSSDINVYLGAGANGVRLLNLDADGTLYSVIIQP